MSRLQLISSEIELNQLDTNLARYANSGDPLLFIASAVSSLLKPEITSYLKQHSIKSYALSADCRCRGIAPMLTDMVEQITDEQMVELSLQHQQTISW